MPSVYDRENTSGDTMTYSFEPFLSSLSDNWYADDELLSSLLARFAAGAAAPDELGAWGAAVAGPMRQWAEESARPENAPYLRHHDAWDRRVDEVVLPASTRAALAEAEGAQQLGALHGDPFAFYAKSYLSSQNGEAGVGCSMACTDGMVRVLEALGDRAEHRQAVEEIRGSTRENVVHGAQFVTEIQGGSDVPANRVEARPDGDAFTLHGQKWFCSNINADYFLVTARATGGPEGGRGVALFLVPAWEGGTRGRRQAYTIDRLKDKLGTRELATAEVTFDGARGWPVGPLEEGVATVVSHVLVTSRFCCILSSAAFLRQAERIVTAFTRFREAFGRPIAEFPLVRQTVEEIGRSRRLCLSALFGLIERWPEDPRAVTEEAVGFRILLSLAKPVLTRRATEGLHEAMMLLAGNGIEERFTPLPRLFRDSVIMETWEGPHNVLLSQALRDLVRFEVDPEELVSRACGESRPELSGALREAMGAAANGDRESTLSFARLAPELVEGFAAQVASSTSR